ncbi:MAG: tetratricopeptide repeat protein [Alphaproteobacteria bacterium]|nr:tetratricopeptide repeat protein [Alphaproteobacteria bacterium]
MKRRFVLLGLAIAIAPPAGAQEGSVVERCFDEPNHVKAEETCTRALDSGSLAVVGQMRVLMARASARLSLGKTDAALGDYRRAIDLKLDDPAPHRARGLALQEQRRHEAAVADFDQALKLAAGDYDRWSVAVSPVSRSASPRRRWPISRGRSRSSPTTPTAFSGAPTQRWPRTTTKSPRGTTITSFA